MAVLPRRLVAVAACAGKGARVQGGGMDFRRTFQMVWHKDKFFDPGHAPLYGALPDL